MYKLFALKKALESIETSTDKHWESVGKHLKSIEKRWKALDIIEKHQTSTTKFRKCIGKV